MADDNTKSNSLLNFCRAKDLDFNYSIIRRMPRTLTFEYWDFRRFDLPDIFEAAKKLLGRQIGFILQQQRGQDEIIQYEFYAKRNMDEGYQKHFVAPIYPKRQVFIPPLLHLWDFQNYPALDSFRFTFLKWTISDKLASVNLSRIPMNYLNNVLTLFFMVHEGFIQVWEADVILLTIKEVEENNLPTVLEYTAVVHEQAFIISFLFSKFYKFISRSFEVVGLSQKKAAINFDGVLFHKNYLQYKTSEENLKQIINDIKDFRIYATIN